MAIYDPKRDATPFQLYAAQYKINREEEETEDAKKTKRRWDFGKAAYRYAETKRIEDMTEAERLYNTRSPHTKTGRMYKYKDPKKSTWKTWFKDRYQTKGSDRVVVDTDYNQAGIEAKAKRDAGYAKIRDDQLAEIEKKREAVKVKYSQPYQFTEADEASFDQVYKETYEAAMDPTSPISRKLAIELDPGKRGYGNTGVFKEGELTNPVTQNILNQMPETTDNLKTSVISPKQPLDTTDPTKTIDFGKRLSDKLTSGQVPIPGDANYVPPKNTGLVPFPDADVSPSIKPPVTDPGVISSAPVSSDAVETSVAAVETVDAGAPTIGKTAGAVGDIYSAYKAGSTLFDDKLTTEQKAIRTLDTGADIASTKAIQAGVSTGNAPLALAGIAYKGFDMLGGPEALEELFT